MTEQLKIRAIDLGYNSTKFTKSIGKDNKPLCMAFPSVAPKPPSVSVDSGFDLEVFDERDTIVVDINGVKFEVGPDSLDIQSSADTRVLHDQYVNSDQYMALALGALHYMGEKEIDVLVVGLPVNNAMYSKELKAKLTGELKINDKEKVLIKNVVVIPQAFGGFKSFYHNNLDNKELFIDEDEITLIVDPGFYTFDFVTLKGYQPPKLLNKRCGSKEGGIHQILGGICNSISENVLEGKKYEDYETIDKALRKDNRSIRIAGETIELEQHIKNTSQLIESVIDYMKNIVGDGIKENIDNIVLIGGNPKIFKKKLENKYPEHAAKNRIFIPDNSIYANVEGFYYYGLENAEKFIK